MCTWRTKAGWGTWGLVGRRSGGRKLRKLAHTGASGSPMEQGMLLKDFKQNNYCNPMWTFKLLLAFLAVLENSGEGWEYKSHFSVQVIAGEGGRETSVITHGLWVWDYECIKVDTTLEAYRSNMTSLSVNQCHVGFQAVLNAIILGENISKVYICILCVFMCVLACGSKKEPQGLLLRASVSCFMRKGFVTVPGACW